VHAGWTNLDRKDPIDRLKKNGVLIERELGPYSRLRFTLDPIAEFLAASAYAEECGSDEQRWNQILMSSAHAPGFVVALELVRQAYAPSLGWPTGT
jgi:hypothetical protein